MKQINDLASVYKVYPVKSPAGDYRLYLKESLQLWQREHFHLESKNIRRRRSRIKSIRSSGLICAVVSIKLATSVSTV